jgi:ATP phosphoribosyltransferase
LRPIVLALPKGRILEEAAGVFARAGHDLSPVLRDTRKLVIDCGAIRVLVLRSSDVATYVAHGAADAGIAGSDVLDEEGRELYEPLDLGIGRCRMIVAERTGAEIESPGFAGARSTAQRCGVSIDDSHIRIATKYPKTTRAYLARKGITAEVIKLSGAIELGPLTGLCDRIVDITQTGETLRQNGLVEVDTISQVSSRLVVNPARLKLDERIGGLIDALEHAIHST